MFSMMTIREELTKSSAFLLEDAVFYQRDLPRSQPFEEAYISLRKRENRVYGDDLVLQLPEVPNNHPLSKEWIARKASTKRLVNYLKKNQSPKKILEIGCGNGWLSRHLASVPQVEVLGVDINENELLQAARLFGAMNLNFLYGNILEINFLQKFNYIVLASSLQYFPDVNKLVQKLDTILDENGEIHIIDSPLYQASEVFQAQQRSLKYFNQQLSGMNSFYHHHSWSVFHRLKMKLLYNPQSMTNKLYARLVSISPFPWIRIVK
jgi:ubiquinone/menaquinone biosynthesis C-methylase UbiE